MESPDIPIVIVLDDLISIDGLCADADPIDGPGLMYAEGVVGVGDVAPLMWLFLPTVRVFTPNRPERSAAWTVTKVCAQGIRGDSLLFRVDAWLRR
jgi:hypothetical protein